MATVRLPADAGAAAPAVKGLTTLDDRRRVPRAHVGRMLMTLASTTTSTATEMSDCNVISALARPVSGIVSVGLNATMLVYAR
jgi:hypothetical protein